MRALVLALLNKFGAKMLARWLVLWLTALCFTESALADGAFPDELTVYLPGNAPNRIMLGTTFGLVISEDGGQTWRFVCEVFITGSTADIVNFYKMGSDGAVLAVTYVHMWRSTDGGCSWTRAAGSVGSLNLTDAFVDPNDPRFVVAVASNSTGSESGIYPSHDGGLTFAAPLYTTPDQLFSVEIASSSGVIYATHVQGTTGNAYLVKSIDSGAHWTAPQRLPVAGGTQPRIAAVDPVDANKVYLRLLNLSTATDAIALTIDGGRTLTTLVTLPSGGTFSSFLRANDGTLYAGTKTGDLYVQAVGESTFSRRVGPRARCLGQRAGSSRIYACADWVLDGYNLGYSDDAARTFQPLMSFTEIAGPLTCPAVNSFCYSWFIQLQQTLGVGLDAGTPGGDRGTGGSGSHCSSVGVGGALALLLVRLLRRPRLLESGST